MEVDSEIDEVQLLIDQINVNNDDNIITARSYIEIDSDLGTEMHDDDEIIAAVQEAPEEEEDDDIGPPIPNKIALESIQNHLQQNNDIQVNSSFVSGLNDLKWKLIENKIVL